VRLRPGAALDGKLLPPAGAGELEVRIFPLDGEAAATQLALHVTRPANDGSFRLRHLRPGRYRLYVHGRGVTPDIRAATVPEAGADVGQIRLKGTGRIVGRLGRPEGIRDPAFVEGEIEIARLALPWSAGGAGRYVVRFVTDEDGRFDVGGVPVGPASVSFPYRITADIIGSHSREVVVKQGEATRVDFAGEG
jgi:hypothetical protein